MDIPRLPLRRSLVVLFLSGLTIGLCFLTVPPTEASRAGVRLALPEIVGSWLGHDEPISEAERTILPADTGFARKQYKNAFGETILASIVLAGTEKRSIHRPEVCLPGQGWTIAASTIVPIPLSSVSPGAAPLRATQLTLERPIRLNDGRQATLRACMLYWYVGDGVTTPLNSMRAWLTAWDRVVHHRNHRWAYVYVLAPVTEGLVRNGRSADSTLAMLREFIAGALPTFQDVATTK